MGDYLKDLLACLVQALWGNAIAVQSLAEEARRLLGREDT